MKSYEGERHLLKIWLINLGFFLVLFVLQLLGRKYGDYTEFDSAKQILYVTAWFVAILLPPLVVLFSLFYSRITASANSIFYLNPKYYQYSKWVSIFYFTVFWAVVLTTPFIRVAVPFEFYVMSSVILFPLQAVLILMLCMLLVTRKKLN